MDLYNFLKLFEFDTNNAVPLHQREQVMVYNGNQWHVYGCKCRSTNTCVCHLNVGDCILARPYALEALVRAKSPIQECAGSIYVKGTTDGIHVPLAVVRVKEDADERYRGVIGVIPFGEPRAAMFTYPHDAVKLYERLAGALVDPSFIKEAFGFVEYDVSSLEKANLGCIRGVLDTLREHKIPFEGCLGNLPDQFMSEYVVHVLKYIKCIKA